MNRLWVKICGNTTLEDARNALRCGASAVGFVFAANSPRRVDAQQVGAITRELPAVAEKFGVFVEQSVEEIAQTFHAAGLSGVQLHSGLERAAEDAARLREMLEAQRRRVGIIQVLHFSEDDVDTFDQKVSLLGKNHAIDAVLIDSRTAQAAGGTGIAYDWRAAQKSFLRAAPHLRLIVAGGLTPANVRQAIHTLLPWGVDVVSGVESEPGKKDAAKVEAFISQAREAAAELNKTPAAAEA